MNDYLKSHLYSASITFISIFLLTLGTSLAGFTSGDLKTDAIVSLIVAAARTAGKAVLEALVPPASVGVVK